MNRFLLSLALGVGLLIGCSDSQSVQTAAGLSGTYDLTAVGDYVFITSADNNELRVLDLNGSPRDWVRAPNPLEPLSIPVLERPIYLARDVRYDTDGNEVTGPYVYARSTGTQELSIVGADPEYFRELKRLSGLGFVTAFAARGAEEGGKSVLYYATQEETGARLFRLELPGPEELLAMGDTAPQSTEITLAQPLADQTVTALLVLPSPEGQEHVVVATRKTSPSAVRGNRTFELDALTGAELLEYQFGGPVRQLATHPAVSSTALPEGTCDLDTTVPPKPSLSAGTYVFGVLDESVCTLQDQEACAGIVAVEADTGALAIDSTGYPMLPIRVGQALPTGLALAANAQVLIRCGGASTIQTRPLIGIVPASDGRINIFDAAKLRLFDFNMYIEDADHNVTATGAAGQTGHAIVDSSGTAKTTTRDPDQYINLIVQDGATRDDTYRVLFQGTLQGLGNRPFSDGTSNCTDTGCTFYVDAESVRNGSGGELAMVRTGDLVSLANANGDCVSPADSTTPIDLQISSIALSTLPDTGEPIGVVTTGPLPQEGCPSPTRYTVRAGSQDPLVVYSDTTGYLGRMAMADGSLPIPGGYFFHPQGFDPVAHPEFRTVSAILNLINPGDLGLVRGDQMVVTAISGLLPFSASVDTVTTTGGLTTFRLPGPVVHTRVSSVDFAYIAYPSADGILQVSLAGLEDNVANITGLVPFE